MATPATEPPPPDAPRPAVPSLWDELRGGDGEVRPEWRALIACLEALGPEELALRYEDGRRILREHGVTCFVADAAGERDVPWELDFLPLVLGAAEWREIERGVLQRARLLNGVLADLHGQQRLVRDGLLPAPLLYANPAYLRACQAIQPPGGVYLHTYAVDLARATDGRWWVVSDRTQAPAGLGFTLENRSIVTRILPEAVQALRPRSLREAFRRRREALRRMAPSGAENSVVAILSRGPRSEAYFENAYLARSLGFTLVEGADLTVRDRRVFLKTLEGLRLVEVILRRVADTYCDPLELHGESLLVVPGLVEATRAGRVAVINALGAGLLESPAFLPFLPGLCWHLFEEELRLPSLATWWCGEVREWTYVHEHLDELVLRTAFGSSVHPTFTKDLAAGERERFLTAFHGRPHDFVAQERVVLSLAPTHDAGPQPVTLRVFAIFDGRDYLVLPGGLARLLPQQTMFAAPALLAGRSKDVWVLPDHEPETEVHLIANPAPIAERAASDLPSRMAENLFWLDRYVERLEGALRECRCVVRHLAGELSASRGLALLGLVDRLGLPQPKAAENLEPAARLQAVLLAYLRDEQHPAGIQALIARVRHGAFAVRDRLSADTWRILSRLSFRPPVGAGNLRLVRAAEALNTLVVQLLAFSGLEMESMTRGHGWVFLDLGRRLERGQHVARLVAAGAADAERSPLLLEPLLEIADSVMTYRRRYFAEPQLPGVLDLLLRDPTNRRSLAFQLTASERLAGDLPVRAELGGVADVGARLAALSARLATADDAELRASLNFFTEELGAISDWLTRTFFSHVVSRVSRDEGPTLRHHPHDHVRLPVGCHGGAPLVATDAAAAAAPTAAQLLP